MCYDTNVSFNWEGYPVEFRLKIKYIFTKMIYSRTILMIYIIITPF